MNERTRKGFIYHTRTEDYKKHLKETIQIIEKIPEDYYVSYSGGKDSTVLTHLCLKANPSRIIWHWDYGDYLIPRPIEEEVMDNLYLLGARRVIYDKDIITEAYRILKKHYNELDHEETETLYSLKLLVERL